MKNLRALTAFITSTLLCLTLVVSMTGCTKGSSKKSSSGSGSGSGGKNDFTTPAQRCTLLGLNPRIINGSTCIEGSSPIVSLVIKADRGVQLCTGTLVKRDTILTAGHCFEADPTEIIVTGGPVGAGSQRTTAASVSVHPKYDNAPDGTLKNDVAVVTLTRALSLPTASIFASTPVENDDEIYIYGFGLDEEEKTGILKSGTMTITDITQDNIFAEFTKETSNSCSGDSGGPVYSRAKRADGQTILGLVGVISAGTNNCNIGERSSFTNLLNPEVLDFVRGEVPGLRID